MAETMTRGVLLGNIQEGYNQLEALLASLSEEQMLMPEVNGPWSVKDNIAHLTAWHNYTLERLGSLLAGEEPPAFMPGLTTEDEENEYIYQQNKNHPLAEVLTGFRASYQRMYNTVQALSEEMLNRHFPGRTNSYPAWRFIAGNTYEHYQEHGDIIRDWLSRVP
ncbi:MAG TPA: ClbS/DfsB family four-helix bundle protein [Ktedonobacteraceae bacterium]|nr:ClbS/DfsB family four-helix bundle protein [Ktedonobacteraceae bacterium]